MKGTSIHHDRNVLYYWCTAFFLILLTLTSLLLSVIILGALLYSLGPKKGKMRLLLPFVLSTLAIGKYYEQRTYCAI